MNKFYKVSYKNESEVVLAERAMEVAGQWTAKNGEVPKIEPCDENGNIIVPPLQKYPELNPPTSTPTIVPLNAGDKGTPVALSNSIIGPIFSTIGPVYSTWEKQVVDDAAKARIENLHKTIEANGGPKIDTSQQLYETGTRLATEGYSTQEARRKRHLEKMPLVDAIHQLQQKVLSEKREDHNVSAKEIGNAISVENGRVLVKGYQLTEQAIRGIIFRLQSPAVSYLLGLQERAYQSDVNMMAEVLRYECLRNPDEEIKLRCRAEPKDIYGAVSKTYGVADAPLVMQQILDKMPSDAKGDYSYDQESTRWMLEAQIYTPTPTEQQSVGEPITCSVKLYSSDNGTSSFNGGGGIELLRCLNASTYSADDNKLRRRHRGDNVLIDIDAMIQKALRSIHALCVAWGKAREDEIDIPTGLTLEQAIPGIWRSLLKEGELAVLPGRKENNIKALTQSYFDERRDQNRVVRADFAQGFTAFIRDQPDGIRQDCELAVGKWVAEPPKHIRMDLKV